MMHSCRCWTMVSLLWVCLWGFAPTQGFVVRGIHRPRRRGQGLVLTFTKPPELLNGESHVDNKDIQQEAQDGDDSTIGISTSSPSSSSSQSASQSLLSSSSWKNDENTPLTQDPSDQRYSASDWLHNVRSLPTSLILRAVRGPVLVMTVWAFLVSLVHALLPCARQFCMSDKPHSFLASALGLLLVFRTNSAYQRFAEARAIWERILSVSRNCSRMALLFEKELGTDRLQRILRLLATFPYLLDDHIHQDYDPNSPEQIHLKALYEEASSSSSSSTSSSTSNTAILAVPRHVYRRERGSHHRRRQVGSIKLQYIDTQQLPWYLLPDATRRRCAVAENRPLFICDRLAREFYTTPLSPNFTHRERATLLSMVDSLSSSMGACERIHQTAVPLNYARHALRCVSLWLLTLPLALVKDFGWATAPVVMCLAWSYFGVYQIGYTIEDPFQSALRLDTLCDIIYRNVMFGTPSMRRRLAALNVEESTTDWTNLPLPPLPGKDPN